MAQQILNNSPSLVCIQMFSAGVCASLYIKHMCSPSHVGRCEDVKHLLKIKYWQRSLRFLMDLVDGGEGV